MKWSLFIGLVFFSIACSDGRPHAPIPERLVEQDKMVDLLTELFVLDAHIKRAYPEFLTQQSVLIQTGDSLMLAHGVKPDDFKASMSYYAVERDQLELIYEKVLDELTKMMGELE